MEIASLENAYRLQSHCPRPLSNLLRNQLNRVFFLQRRATHLSNRDYNSSRSCGDTMIDAVAIKSPNRRRDCPSARFKIPLTKGISSYWYQHRRFGYISLVTFGSRWTPCTQRAGGPNRCELLAIGHRARSNNTRKPVRVPFVSFYIPPRCRMLALSFGPRQRFTAIPCKTFTNTRG